MLTELARGALRRKLAALREALQRRFAAHHALLVGAWHRGHHDEDGGRGERRNGRPTERTE